MDVYVLGYGIWDHRLDISRIDAGVCEQTPPFSKFICVMCIWSECVFDLYGSPNVYLIRMDLHVYLIRMDLQMCIWSEPWPSNPAAETATPAPDVGAEYLIVTLNNSDNNNNNNNNNTLIVIIIVIIVTITHKHFHIIQLQPLMRCSDNLSSRGYYAIYLFMYTYICIYSVIGMCVYIHIYIYIYIISLQTLSLLKLLESNFQIIWVSGKSPMGLRISPLRIKIVLESNPLKPAMLIGGLGVLFSGGVFSFADSTLLYSTRLYIGYDTIRYDTIRYDTIRYGSPASWELIEAAAACSGGCVHIYIYIQHAANTIQHTAN